MRLAPQTIEALAQIISGGGGNDSAPPIGIDRSGPKLENFMRACGVHMAIGGGLRMPTLTTSLIGLIEREEADVLRTVIERAADPRDFVRELERLLVVIAHLNGYLIHDGLELRQEGMTVRLMRAGTSAPIVSALAEGRWSSTSTPSSATWPGRPTASRRTRRTR